MDQSLSLSHRIDMMPRPDRASEAYHRHLAGVRLTPADQREIAALHARLDKERASHGLPPATRAPWTQEDILEWKGAKRLTGIAGLTADERYRDLKTYADACDRISGTVAQRIAA